MFVISTMPVTRAQSREQDGATSRTPPHDPQSSASVDQDPDTPFSESSDPQPFSPPRQVSEKAVTPDIDTTVPISGDVTDNDGDCKNEEGSMAAMDEERAAVNDDGKDHSRLPTSQPSGGDDNSVSVLPAKRKRKGASNDIPRKSRRLSKSHSETDTDGVEEFVEERWNDRILFPNELMLRGGSANAFTYNLVCGEKLVINHLDVFRTSLKRFINENVLQVAADLILREKGCTPDEGWVWMHETFLTSAIVENKLFDRYVPSPSRMNMMMNSKVLLVPVQTASSSHWSLVALTNLKSVRSECLKLKPARGGGYRKTDGTLDEPKALAIHFDSMQTSNHKSATMLFRKFISFCLTEAWKEENRAYYERKKVTPDLRRVVARNLPFVQGKAPQQEDGTTCGWRTVDAVRFMADHKKSGADWNTIFRKDFVSMHVEIATRSLRHTQWKALQRVSDIPSTLFPVNKVLDNVCCSEFECNMSNANKTLATYFKSKSSDLQSSKRNEKKIAMNKKFEEVYAVVAEKMKDEGLNVRRKLNKTIRMKTSHCKTIARYLFPFPRGEQYALSTYYTQNNYPDSILVCSGLNFVLQKNPRVAREYLGSSAARVPKRKRVQHQMAVFLDWNRSKARRWDTNARFRLQELVIHFVGIGEAVFKACCRQAMYNEDNAAASKLESGKESRPKDEKASREPVKITEIESDGEGEWSFENSLTIEDGADENGQIRCSVSPRILGSALPHCLTSAEQVANDAILDCVADFENHCKRVLQLSGNVRISEVECYVTGSSMAVIHKTFKETFKSRLLARINIMWGHVLNEGFVCGSVESAISRLIDAAEKYFIRNGKLFLKIPDSSSGALLAEPFVKRRKRPNKKYCNDESDYEEPPRSLNASRSDAAPLENTPTKVRNVRCFGLGLQTTCINLRSKPATGEFLALLFYLLQGCRGHERRESYYCREFASRKWGNDLPECQKLLQDVWNTFAASVEKFGKDFDRVAVKGEDATFEDELMKLRFDVIVRAASKVADVSNRSAVNRSDLCQSDVFCFDVPPSYLGDTSVRNGQEFLFCFRAGERDTALWHGSVTEITCESIPHDETGISVSGENAVIGDFPISKEDAPKLYKLSLNVTIKCMYDFWNDPGQIEAVGKSFLGFRMHECVRLVFAFQNGKNAYVRSS